MYSIQANAKKTVKRWERYGKKKKSCNFVTLAAEAHVMKIHVANLNFFSLTRWTTKLEGTNKLVEQGTMHRRRPIKNAPSPPLLLVLNQWDTISRFHYEWCATNLICISRDKKCNILMHGNGPLPAHIAAAPQNSSNWWYTLSSKEFRLRICFEKEANEFVAYSIIKCLTFSLILNSILQFSASRVFENMLPACDMVNGDENRKLDDEKTRARARTRSQRDLIPLATSTTDWTEVFPAIMPRPKIVRASHQIQFW